MDRQIVYPGQIPLETDLLNTNKYAMVAIAKLAAAALGTSTVVSGLACVPTGPASLQVLVNPGEIYSLVATDASAYSSLSADAHTILKQGISLDDVPLTCTPPVTAGQSINYLIQAAYQDSDTGLVVLPYYNASNPSQAYSGPNNSGAQQATAREGIVVISAKPGIAATTGSQTTPAPDAGFTGLWVVTVANGQTTITSGSIAKATNAPILAASLLDQILARALLNGDQTKQFSVAPATQSQHAVQLGQVGHGQCRLSVVSGTSLKLSPYNGNNLIINGVPQQIPAAGVTIANTGLTASTLYYVYAYMNAGSMALELSATGHATGSNGVEQKTGDATRTLVGMLYTTAATPGQFVDSVTNRQIANWFNRRNIPAVATLSVDTNFSGGSLAKVTTSLDIVFPYWGDNDGGIGSFTGSVSNNTSGGQSQLALYVDGSQFGNTSSCSVSGSVIQNAPVSSLSLLNNVAPLAEGFHTASAYGASSSGSTSTLRASSVVVAQTRA